MFVLRSPGARKATHRWSYKYVAPTEPGNRMSFASDPCISSDVPSVRHSRTSTPVKRQTQKVCRPVLLPKEQKKKQRDPKSIHEMPVDRGRISRACAPQFALDR